MNSRTGPRSVPEPVVAALAGVPEVGAREQAFLFLTTDPEGFPHVCLLSRAEMDADASEIRAVIASPQTCANVRRDGRATLVVVAGDAAHYCKLQVRREQGSSELLAGAFEVVSHKADSAGTSLWGVTYSVEEHLRVQEHWEETARHLDDLEGSVEQR